MNYVDLYTYTRRRTHRRVLTRITHSLTCTNLNLHTRSTLSLHRDVHGDNVDEHRNLCCIIVAQSGGGRAMYFELFLAS